MKVVIPEEQSGGHSVSRYQFKILSSMAGMSVAEAVHEIESTPISEPIETINDEFTPPVMARGSKDELIESMMKKADEMSSSVIKMQMKIEELNEQKAAAVEEARRVGYEEGFAAGAEEQRAKLEQQSSQTHEMLSQSIATLDKSAEDFKKSLDAIQKELTYTALDIAKEVIALEIQENSQKIAARLSSELIDELQSASKITLRVNPQDHGYISERVGSLVNVEVLSDRAISPGGVVAISDMGNIDSEIKKRYEKLKRSLFLEK